jgi:hypothetical protein
MERRTVPTPYVWYGSFSGYPVRVGCGPIKKSGKSREGVLSMKISGFRIKAFLTVALLCACIAACGGSPAPVSTKPVSAEPAAPAGADELDAAIREASTYLNGRVPKSSKAVFLNIRSDYPDLSEYLLNVLSENAVNDGAFSVVDRQQLDTIRAELDFQMSGEVSDESAQNIGQMLGAQTIVSGAVSKLGSLYRVQVKAIEVQSAGVQGQWSRNIPNGATIAALTEKFVPAPAAIAIGASSARSGSSGATAAPASAASGGTAVPAQAPAPIVKDVYAIGETGPAGGIVFYDKGSNSGGWRYLEAAPASTEGKDLQWSVSSFDTSAKGVDAGTGKQNTRNILDASVQAAINAPAARFCDRLEYGGYDDWYLPSKNELGLMYMNLKVDGIGGLGNTLYWSSSESGDRDGVWAQDFRDGKQYSDGYDGYGEYSGVRYRTKCVRAIRQF